MGVSLPYSGGLSCQLLMQYSSTTAIMVLNNMTKSFRDYKIVS